jgi:large conductance mechanosensitive channel
MIKEFKAFALKGNLLELAVAFILSLAFSAVITAFIEGVIMPFIAAVVGKPNFDALTLEIGDGVIRYGTFLTTVVNFLLVAFVLFLLIKASQKVQKPAAHVSKECPHCLSTIPAAASVCNSCTREVPATT